MAKALQLADVALKDPQEYENALNLKLEILGDGLKTKDDSLKYVENLKSLYAEHKTNGVMEKLYNTLIGVGQSAEADKIIDEALAADPNNFVALADKGLSLLQAQKAEEAVKYLKRAYDIKNDNAIIATYAGTAYVVQAQNVEDPAKKKELYKQAIEMFDKAKELDPDMLQAKWGYNRYNAYYNYYGENAPETKQAEQDSH
jgi:tetratricopeptide (TPR) repeat protein